MPIMITINGRKLLWGINPASVTGSWFHMDDRRRTGSSRQVQRPAPAVRIATALPVARHSIRRAATAQSVVGRQLRPS
jgi:hypothetical protein